MVSTHLVGFVSESIYFGLTTSILARLRLAKKHETWFDLTRLLWRLTIPKFTVASRQRPVNQPLIMNMNIYKTSIGVSFHETPWFIPRFVSSSLFLMGFCYSGRWYIYIRILITMHIYIEKNTLTLTSFQPRPLSCVSKARWLGCGEDGQIWLYIGSWAV